MTNARLILIDIDAARLTTSVSFNGVILQEGFLPERIHRAVRLNGWVTRGSNRLVVKIGGGDPRPRTSGDVDPPAFSLKLREAASAGDIVSLVEFTLDPSAQPLPAGSLLTVIDQSFEFAGFGEWVWQRAVRMPRLGPGEVADIANHLAAVHRALSERSAAEVVRLQSIQISEQSSAVGGDAAAAMDRHLALLQERMAAPDWRVAPFDHLGLKVVSMADGRVHHVTDAQGNPPILAHGGDSTLGIDPFVARVGGQWQIVR